MTTTRRLLSEQEQTNLKNILLQAPIGFLAILADGPYVVPINFAYDGSDEPEGWGRVIFHSGEGKKSVALAADSRVCMAVVTETAFDRGATPCDDGFTYRSTLVEGKAALLTNHAEREVALRMIVAKYDPEAVRDAFNEQIFERTLVYSVEIESVSFKQRSRRT
jgi:hypothetical protein